MTEIKRHKFDELYKSYFGTAGKGGVRVGATTTYTLFEHKCDVDDRELMKPVEMVAVQQEGNVVVLNLSEFSDEFIWSLRRFGGISTFLAVNRAGAEEALRRFGVSSHD